MGFDFSYLISLVFLVYVGLEKIEYLQLHSSDKIYALAGRIIEKYFSENDGTSDNTN